MTFKEGTIENMVNYCIKNGGNSENPKNEKPQLYLQE
jgi:hypothetical protein